MCITLDRATIIPTKFRQQNTPHHLSFMARKKCFLNSVSWQQSDTSVRQVIVCQCACSMLLLGTGKLKFCAQSITAYEAKVFRIMIMVNLPQWDFKLALSSAPHVWRDSNWIHNSLNLIKKLPLSFRFRQWAVSNIHRITMLGLSSEIREIREETHITRWIRGY